MKKLISLLLALTITLSVCMCFGFSAAAESTETLAVTVNGVTTNVAVGDTFTYTYTLSDLVLKNCEAVLYYDSDMVTLTAPDEDDDDAVAAFKQSSFPVIYQTVIYNADLTDKVKFNFSYLDNYRLTGEQILATFEFTAKAAGETTINMEILAMADSNNQYIVKKTSAGPVVMQEFTSAEYITYDAPTEAPTEEPTVEPTEPETEPTEPETEPTEPETEPTEPETEPTEAKAIKVENITYSATANTISLSWDAADGCFKYWVYKYLDSTGTWAIAASTGETTAVVKNLSPNTTYKFKVIGKFAADYSIMDINKADVVEATTGAPAAPGSMAITTGLNEAEISWEAVDGATKYWIYKATNVDGPYYIAGATTDTSAVMGSLQNNMTYYFRIASLTTQNGTPVISDPMDSPYVSITTPKTVDITTALDVNTATTATISWKGLEGAEKYWVMYSTTTTDTTASGWTTAGTTTDVTTLNVRNLTPNTVYHFTVRARYTDAAGAVKTYDYIPVSFRTAYSDTDVITFTQEGNYIRLTWAEDITDVTKTWVYAYDAEGNQVAMSASTTNTALIKKFDGFEDCYYELYTINVDGVYGYLTPSGGELYHE